ncbi:MAG: aminotransferase class III-fold pyridoxal phosphate-dependent enzyme [Alphaproteobacteria bacterium]|nr:aminotransferase class III-fold pyridoxal phosphate-dependent enzyme [Alphaproteobacteria bacterium]
MILTHTKDEELKARAEKVIPGGMYGHESTRLLPANYPQYIARAKGARMWDADGNEYIDYMCAYGPNLFGYANEAIDAAAVAQLARGDAATGPAPLMVDLAEAFVAQVSHADWAMFCKNGTDATTMAMTVARAHTGKRKILVATGAYHGAAPWCTPLPSGTLPEDRAHVVHYTYNDIESLDAAVKSAAGDLAGIFASPFKHDAFQDQQDVDAAYARRAREHCDRTGALLIVDDVRAGFRLARDSSWSLVGVAPDLSSWGKCIANGHAISALLGAEKAREAASSIFVTGSFWFAAVPMAAALKTLELIRTTKYLEHTQTMGRDLRIGLQQQAAAHGFTLRQTGPEQMPQILFEDDPDFRLGFAWAEEACARGIYLHPWHNMFICAALTEGDARQTLTTTDEAFAAVKKRRATLKPHPTVVAMLSAHLGH